MSYCGKHEHLCSINLANKVVCLKYKTFTYVNQRNFTCNATLVLELYQKPSLTNTIIHKRRTSLEASDFL